MIVEHLLLPVYDEDSKVLILGSFPSVASREAMFYYAHPQNQFWPILSDLFETEIIDKKAFLHEHHIALFDVIKSCEINGSLDSSIKNVQVNDIKSIVLKTKIKYILTTGKKAYDLYNKYLKDYVGLEAILLPSTSPLNARMTYQEKREHYAIIRDLLND